MLVFLQWIQQFRYQQRKWYNWLLCEKWDIFWTQLFYSTSELFCRIGALIFQSVQCTLKICSRFFRFQSHRFHVERIKLLSKCSAHPSELIHFRHSALLSWHHNRNTISVLFDFLLALHFRMQDKTADFKVGQNNRFWKRDKIADFDNETKPPILSGPKPLILKWNKTADL